MILHSAQGKPVEIGEAVGHGGEATVYQVVSPPANGAEKYLAKIYETEPRPDYPLKLGWMIEHPPENPTAALSHPSMAWPDSLLFDSKHQLKGYCMPYIEQAVPLLEVFNPRRRAVVLPQFDRRYLHRTARNLAAALSALHGSGYVAGDVNESNVLVTPSALVTLIDTDSFQVREKNGKTEVLYRCPVGKPEYTPPELQGKVLAEMDRLPEHDSFGLAVLIFQLLMGGSHPFRAQWSGDGDPPPIEKRIADGAFPYGPTLPANIAPPRNAPGLETLHPWLGELFRRCFVDGHRSPRWRPGPALWVKAIGEAEAMLVCCAEGHFYAGHLLSCPYCALAIKPRAVMPAQSGKEVRDRQRAARNAPAAPPAAARTLPNSPAAGTAAPGTKPVVSSGPAAASSVGNSGVGSAGVLHSRPVIRPGAARTWLRQWISLSLTVGSAQGAAAGILPGALVALWCWMAGSPLDWGMVLSLGGAAGGLLRGWRPGYRLATLVDRFIGWKRFWEALGLAAGGAGGGLLGFLMGWAVIPVILGLVLGARIGIFLGSKIWQLGSYVGWERIWGGISALGAAGLGWGAAKAAGVLGMNTFGVQLAVGLQPYSGDGLLASALLWLVAGGLSGGLFGAIAGLLVDLAGRFARLTR